MTISPANFYRIPSAVLAGIASLWLVSSDSPGVLQSLKATSKAQPTATTTSDPNTINFDDAQREYNLSLQQQGSKELIDTRYKRERALFELHRLPVASQNVSHEITSAGIEKIEILDNGQTIKVIGLPWEFIPQSDKNGLTIFSTMVRPNPKAKQTSSWGEDKPRSPYECSLIVRDFPNARKLIIEESTEEKKTPKGIQKTINLEKILADTTLQEIEINTSNPARIIVPGNLASNLAITAQLVPNNPNGGIVMNEDTLEDNKKVEVILLSQPESGEVRLPNKITITNRYHRGQVDIISAPESSIPAINKIINDDPRIVNAGNRSLTTEFLGQRYIDSIPYGESWTNREVQKKEGL